MNPGLLNEWVKVSRVTREDTGVGGWKEKPVDVGRVLVRVSTAVGRPDRVNAMKADAEISHRAYFTPGEDVKARDTLTRENGQTLEVVQVEDRPGPGGYAAAGCREFRSST